MPSDIQHYHVSYEVSGIAKRAVFKVAEGFTGDVAKCARKALQENPNKTLFILMKGAVEAMEGNVKILRCAEEKVLKRIKPPLHGWTETCLDLVVGAFYWFFRVEAHKEYPELNAFADRFLQKRPEHMVGMLKTFATLSGVQRLNQTADLVGKISQAAKKGPEAVKALSDNIVKQASGKPVTVPIGYYRGDTWCPVFVTIEKKDDQFLLRFVNTDPARKGELDKIDPLHAFKMDEADAVAKLLQILIPFHIKGAVQETTKTSNKNAFVVQMTNSLMQHGAIGSGNKTQFADDPTHFQPTDVYTSFLDLVTDLGGKTVAQKTASIKTSGDWWKQVRLLAGTDLTKEQKLHFEVTYLNHHLTVLSPLLAQKGYRGLSFQEKKAHLLAFETALSRLRNKYAKFYHSEGIFDKIWTVHTKLEAIEKEIGFLKETLAKERLAELSRPLKKTERWDYTFQIAPAPGGTKKQEVKADFLVEFSRHLDNFETAFEKIEERFKQKDFDAVYQAVPALLHTLSLDPKDWEIDDYKKIEQWSLKITTLVHHFFEAHIRKHKLTLQTEEAIAIAAARTVQMMLIRRCKEKQLGGYGQGWFDKWCDYKEILDMLNRSPFYRTGFDPFLDQRARTMREYFDDKTRDLEDWEVHNSYQLDEFLFQQSASQNGWPKLILDMKCLNVYGRYFNHPESTKSLQVELSIRFT